MRLPDIHAAEPIPDAAREEIERLLKTGDLFRYTASENAPAALLEQEFAEMIGSRFAVAVSSCSAALFLSLKALNLPASARVLIPAFTFAAVPSSVVHAGLIPILCEVGMNYRIDLADFATRLPGADAVIISHMRGHTSDMDAIMELCDSQGIPLIEDAAHSLGTIWKGRRIGTMGRLGCFSFQSYKMINAGEGGILVTDDPDLAARVVIMSGAYEHNWKKHPVWQNAFAAHQNSLPIYNLRLNNLSATLIRAQLPELPRRVKDGLRNHNHMARRLSDSPFIHVPSPLDGEVRAPDSIQFNLKGLSDGQIRAFAQNAKQAGVTVQVFGQSEDNARAFWNWKFLEEIPELPQTKAMLMNACDVRLPVQLSLADCDVIADVLLRSLNRAAHAAA